MDSETLSRTEIDRLLGKEEHAGAGQHGVGGGSTHLDTHAVQRYDFRRPMRLSKERVRTLEAMYERLVTAMESWMTSCVRGAVQMRLQSVEQFSFGEFTLALPTPCASFIINIAGAGGHHAIIDVGHEFVFAFVDRLFGGAGQEVGIARPLTRVERMAMRGAIERMTSLLHDIWADYVPLTLEMSAFESFPDILLQTTNRDDAMLVANIEVSLGDINSAILICMPCSVLDAFFATNGKRPLDGAMGSDHERAVNRDMAEQALRVTRVNVTAKLPEFRMTMRDLGSLKPGGTITTPLAPDTPIRVLIGGQERFYGVAGRAGHALAVQLLGVISDKDGTSQHQGVASVQFNPSIVPPHPSTPSNQEAL